MSPARPGRRPVIDTAAILEAVSVLGVRWTSLFTTWEITSVNEALDRELLSGNLLNAFTLSAKGNAALAELLGEQPRARLDLRIEPSCVEHERDCWTVSCLRCNGLHVGHVDSGELSTRVRTIIDDHGCVPLHRGTAA